MKAVVFGLTISSSWGNGHATLWRALCRSLHRDGHEVVFFERDVPYYAQHRDLPAAAWCRIVLYRSWDDLGSKVIRELHDADAAIVTSYCPDSNAATRAVLDSMVPRKVFYDLDSPMTLHRLARGEQVDYIPDGGLGGFDLVLSYAGGSAIEGLKDFAGARVVAPLYGSADPEVHFPVAPVERHRNDLSYLGTYAAERQDMLEAMFVAPARARPDRVFALAGSQYPDDFPWTENMLYFWHMPPADHPSLFCSSGLTLNVTRRPMAAVGYCPSGRLFEATACGAAVVSDSWEGLDSFFEPSQQILIARDTADVLAALDLSPEERRRIGAAGRERTLDCHTAAVRARELEQLLEPSWRPSGDHTHMLMNGAN
jgi:spore maturation protein CgeB